MGQSKSVQWPHKAEYCQKKSSAKPGSTERQGPSFPQLLPLPLTKTSFLLLLRAVTRENMTRVLSPAEEDCPSDSPERVEATEQSHGGRGGYPALCESLWDSLSHVPAGKMAVWSSGAKFLLPCPALLPGRPAVSPQTTEFLSPKACRVDFL